MISGTPMSILKPILIVGALSAIGMGGYNLATTGSPLGACDASSQSATMTSVSGIDSSAPSDESSACARKVAPVQLTSVADGASGSMGCCGEKPADSTEKDGCSMGTAQAGIVQADVDANHCESQGDSPVGIAQLTSDASQGDETAECAMSATKASYDPNHCEDKDATECEKPSLSDSAPEQTADTEQVETGTSEG